MESDAMTSFVATQTNVAKWRVVPPLCVRIAAEKLRCDSV
jgi:hypothetical protein